LDCLDAPTPPFAKGTLVAFRSRLIATNADRRLIERTIELAQTSGGFGARALRAALDSSPLWGAGRVEDTINLLGHALRKSVRLLARTQGCDPHTVAAGAGLDLLAGPSLKAALDLDWDDPSARDHALVAVLDALERVEMLIANQAARRVRMMVTNAMS
jgi:transposase